MAKKKETPKLSPEQYWQWSNAIAETFAAKNKEESRKWQLKSLQQDAEIASLKAHIFKFQDLNNAITAFSDADKQYKELKKELEDTLGISLNGAIIDSVNFEVNHGD